MKVHLEEEEEGEEEEKLLYFLPILLWLFFLDVDTATAANTRLAH